MGTIKQENSIDMESYCMFLKGQAKIIRETSLDLKQIIFILQNIQSTFKCKTHNSDNWTMFCETITELNIAFQISYSNYKKGKSLFWAILFGRAIDKIPKLQSMK